MEIKVYMGTGTITHTFNDEAEFLATLFRYLFGSQKVQLQVSL